MKDDWRFILVFEQQLLEHVHNDDEGEERSEARGDQDPKGHGRAALAQAIDEVGKQAHCREI